jgi:hypothetical protein
MFQDNSILSESDSEVAAIINELGLVWHDGKSRPAKADSGITAEEFNRFSAALPPSDPTAPACSTCGLTSAATAPSINSITGATEYACKYIIDPFVAEQVTLVEKHCNIPAWRDANGQLKIKGVAGIFCSVACLAEGLLTYGRCAGCAKKLKRKKFQKDWMVKHDGEGVKMYGAFDYCSPECKRAFADSRHIWAAAHLLKILQGLGIECTQTAIDSAVIDSGNGFKWLCGYKSCGKGRDKKGNRARARVPEKDDFCSTACRKATAEVNGRKKTA